MCVCYAMKNVTRHVMGQGQGTALVVNVSKMDLSAYQSAPPASMMLQGNANPAMKIV